MIGNDIVDLSIKRNDDPKRRQRFLDKVYSDAEQKLIANHTDFHFMQSLLWCMKEAAYKVLNRIEQNRCYFPKGLDVNLQDITAKTAQGVVNVDEFNFSIFAEIHDDFIHSVAFWGQKRAFWQQIIHLEESTPALQSAKAKALFAEKYPHMELSKNDRGIPTLKGKKTEKLVSIAHHGNWVSVVALEA